MKESLAETFDDRKPVVIAGMPCSGKTAILRELSDIASLKVCDLDERIEESQGKTIKDFIRVEGIAKFRAVETCMLRSLLSSDHDVISLGGGALTTVENRRLLQKSSCLVSLSASLNTLLHRALKDEEEATATGFGSKRPLLHGEDKCGAEKIEVVFSNLVKLDKARWHQFCVSPIFIVTEWASPAIIAHLITLVTQSSIRPAERDLVNSGSTAKATDLWNPRDKENWLVVPVLEQSRQLTLWLISSGGGNCNIMPNAEKLITSPQIINDLVLIRSYSESEIVLLRPGAEGSRTTKVRRVEAVVKPYWEEKAREIFLNLSRDDQNQNVNLPAVAWRVIQHASELNK